MNYGTIRYVRGSELDSLSHREVETAVNDRVEMASPGLYWVKGNRYPQAVLPDSEEVSLTGRWVFCKYPMWCNTLEKEIKVGFEVHEILLLKEIPLKDLRRVVLHYIKFPQILRKEEFRELIYYVSKETKEQ